MMRKLQRWLTGEEVKELKGRGFELTDSYTYVEDALDYIDELNDINRDPSYMVSVAGLHADEDFNTYVVYKYSVIY